MLLAIGIGRAPGDPPGRDGSGAFRSATLAASLAALFLFYPTDYDRPGLRGSFDLAFARQTRIGLRTKTPLRDPSAWRGRRTPQGIAGREAVRFEEDVAGGDPAIGGGSGGSMRIDGAIRPGPPRMARRRRMKTD